MTDTGNEHKIIALDCDKIRDRSSFHHAFAEVFNFPAFYGKNGDAWIDCMTYPSMMTDVGIQDEDIITIRLLNSAGLKIRCPNLFEHIFELSGFVNFRRIEANEPGRICISVAPNFE